MHTPEAPEPKRHAAGGPSRQRRRFLLLVAIGILAVFASDARRISMWTTSDEPPHLLAAQRMKSGLGLDTNLEHPAATKLLAAAGLGAAPAPTLIEEIRAGRRAFPFLFGLLVFSAGLLAARLSGFAAGLAVSSLLLLDPSLRAHGAIVQSDVPLTAFLSCAALALTIRGRPLLAVLLAGSLYGLGAATKFSALPFLPVFLGAAVLPDLRRRGYCKAAKKSVVFVCAALLTIAAVQGWAYRGTAPENVRAAIIRELQNEGLKHRVPAYEAGFTLLPVPLMAYAAGMDLVGAYAAPGFRFNYLFGRLSPTGFRSYFVVALLVKLLTATALLLVLSIPLAIFVLRRGPAANRRRFLLTQRTLFAGLVATGYLGAASTTSLNIGVRHVFPVIPFALIAAAGVISTAFRPRGRRAILILVVALSAAEAVACMGREISFGNLFAGGPAGIHRILSDSNVDWGQEQGKLFERVRQGDLGRVGVAAVFLDESEALRAGVVARPARPAPDLDTVIVSVHLVDIAAAVRRTREKSPRYEWLRSWLIPLMDDLERRKKRVEPLGDSYLIYELH